VNVSPRDISYVEAHGTGTAIGDPIEVKALKEVFDLYSKDRSYCGIGSVKTNIGHLHSAAGIASVIKIALSFYHLYLPGTLNCSVPNPRLEFENTPFFPNVFGREWKTRGRKRKAVTSGFGFGGTNCHILFEEGP
jgi:acyl transferase domain-containing protein